MEQDLKKSLDEINQNLGKLKPSRAGEFYNGILRGVGSVVGIALAIALLGFILNVVGVIPAFRERLNSWQDLLEQTQQQQFNPFRSLNSGTKSN